ncbi:hypothetical protein E2C01_097688 [Portunus trituberculatus]|uniref:Uncharacterized protein n=1 Tax=Portunus trituberculatus TaxID=210409 RepID=A0A5B7KAN3_PORTR|nr:hypothetical protein [Portunus trituberculatus]
MNNHKNKNIKNNKGLVKRVTKTQLKTTFTYSYTNKPASSSSPQDASTPKKKPSPVSNLPRGTSKHIPLLIFNIQATIHSIKNNG